MGFGRARYAQLQRVAENPAPADVQGYFPVLAHGRWKLGVLGGGRFDQPFFDDVCD